MNQDNFADCVSSGVETYFRAFALAGSMQLRCQGGVEWVSPKPGAAGPSIVFKVSLDEETADSRIDELISRIKAGTAPSMWFVSPSWTPGNIVDILLAKGFKDVSNPDEPEPAMALDLRAKPVWPAPNLAIAVKSVESLTDFSLWCDVVNEALHGWPMVTPEHYSPWLGHDGIALYLAYLGNMPVATAATMRGGGQASLEFVATLKEHRRKGAATAACILALKELEKQGESVVTLRACHDGTPLYERLGFKIVYPTTMLSYPIDEAKP